MQPFKGIKREALDPRGVACLGLSWRGGGCSTSTATFQAAQHGSPCGKREVLGRHMGTLCHFTPFGINGTAPHASLGVTGPRTSLARWLEESQVPEPIPVASWA